mgnify:CR=1 FL=1
MGHGALDAAAATRAVADALDLCDGKHARVAEAGLAASSLLAHLAEDEMAVEASVPEARARVRWLSNVSRRRAGRGERTASRAARLRGDGARRVLFGPRHARRQRAAAGLGERGALGAARL